MSESDMGLHRSRAYFASAISTLSVILLLCVLAVRRPNVPVGLRIPIVRIPKQSMRNCSDPNRIVFIRLTRDGRMWINSTDYPPERLTALVALIMERRSDHIVYVAADSQVAYGQFADFLGKIASAAPNLRIAFLSNQLQKEFEEYGGAFCELEWPRSELTATIK